MGLIRKFRLLSLIFLLFLFNISLVYAANNAQFVGQTVPSRMIMGQSYTVSITMKNTGNTTWTRAGVYRLGSVNPYDNWNWGLGRVELSASDSIAPGQTKTFTFTVKPQKTGNLNFQWCMVQEGVAWFGDKTASVVISVNVSCNSDGTDSSGQCNTACGASRWCNGLLPMASLPFCAKAGNTAFGDMCSAKCQPIDRRDGPGVCHKSGISDCTGDAGCYIQIAGRCSVNALKKCDGNCLEIPSCGDGLCNCGEMPSTCPADCHAICAPGAVSGCNLCNPTGTAWWVDDSKCSKGQICKSGTCVPKQRSVWYNALYVPPGSTYTATGTRDWLDLFTKEDQWADARPYADVFEVFGWPTIEVFNNASQAKPILSKINSWGMKLALEDVSVTAGWCSGEVVAKGAIIYRLDNIKANGGTVQYIAMNEPFMGGVYMGAGEAGMKSLEPCNLTIDQTIEEVIAYIDMIHSKYPDIVIGDTEPYPYFSKEDLMQWIVKFKEKSGYEFPFFHIDIDSVLLGESDYQDMKELQDFCRKRGIEFGLIFISFDNRTDQDYYNDVMYKGSIINKTMGMPDQILLESWVTRPLYNLPDNANYSYTQLLRDFARTYIVPGVAVCTPNAVSGCKICKPDGSGWVDDSSFCPSGQVCQSGYCRLPNGGRCSNNSQCTSGFCSNTVCCNTGQCGWGAENGNPAMCVNNGGTKSNQWLSGVCRNGQLKTVLDGWGCGNPKWPCDNGTCICENASGCRWEQYFCRINNSGRDPNQMVSLFNFTCPSSCQPGQDCTCTVSDCSNGLFIVRNLQGQPINITMMIMSGDFPLTFFSSSPYERSFTPTANGTVSAVAVCLEAGKVKAQSRQIEVN